MTYPDHLQPEERHDVGQHDGETCGRYPEPDEDQPRGYKPKPCKGVMRDDAFTSDLMKCDTCGEIG